MAFVTFEELLKRAEEFERKLERYYAEIRDRSKDNGVRLLTYYLARHRRHLDRALETLSPEERREIGTVRLKYDVEFDPESDIELVGKEIEHIRARELLESAISHDEELVRFYKRILDQPLSDDARSLVAALIRIEEKDIVMMKKMIAMNYF